MSLSRVSHASPSYMRFEERKGDQEIDLRALILTTFEQASSNQARIEALEARLAQSDARIDAQDIVINSLNEEVAGLQAQSERDQQRIGKLEKNNESLKKDQCCLTGAVVVLGIGTGGLGAGLVVAAEGAIAVGGYILLGTGSIGIAGGTAAGCKKKTI